MNELLLSVSKCSHSIEFKHISMGPKKIDIFLVFFFSPKIKCCRLYWNAFELFDIPTNNSKSLWRQFRVLYARRTKIRERAIFVFAVVDSVLSVSIRDGNRTNGEETAVDLCIFCVLINKHSNILFPKIKQMHKTFHCGITIYKFPILSLSFNSLLDIISLTFDSFVCFFLFDFVSDSRMRQS